VRSASCRPRICSTSYLADRTPDIRELTREAPIIPESLDARDVVAILATLPSISALCTTSTAYSRASSPSADILEAIVGSFHTEHGPAELRLRQRDDGSYLISGWMPALEFADLLDIELPSRGRTRPLRAFCCRNSARSRGRRQDFAGGGSSSRRS
jgi:hypothetical protein